jgi:hypothetical protein
MVLAVHMPCGRTEQELTCPTEPVTPWGFCPECPTIFSWTTVTNDHGVGGHGTLTALSGAAGSLWSFVTPPSDTIRGIGALAGAGGAVVLDQFQGLISVDASGNPGTPSGGPFLPPNSFFTSSFISPISLGNWIGPVNGLISMVVEPAVNGALSVTNFAVFPYPMAGGDAQGRKHYQQPVIAHFIPIEAAQLGIDPQVAIAQIKQALPQPKIATHLSFLGTNATVQSFVDTLKSPLSAVGFIGHSVDVGDNDVNPTTFTSIGLSLADANQVLVLPPNPRTPFTIPEYANSITTTRIQTEAKVVFIGSCFIGPDFQSLWNIGPSTKGQVMVVPTSAGSSVILGHALVAWDRLLDDLVLQHMTVGSAVTDTNTYLKSLPPDVNGNPITEQWQPVGDSSVKIN